MFQISRAAKRGLLNALVLLGLLVLMSFPYSTRHVAPAKEASSLRLNRLQAVPTSSSSQYPIIQGWGGVTLDEVSSGQLQPTLQRLNQSGYNGVRIGFSGGVTSCSSGELGSWSPDWFSQALQAAQQYGMWVILDYHSYGDLVNSGCQTQWLSFWDGVLSTNWGYDRIVWEPINEPAGSVTVLSSAYQAWTTQARGLGDKHWVAVENTISNGGCGFDPLSLVGCYPVITDPLNETFLSIHPYLFYDIWLGNGYGACSPSASNSWGNSTAECVANVYNQGMLQASRTYHMPILDTEGGAVYYSCNSVCANPPDAVGTDDASYSYTTFHFIQYLTNLMQSENMGWIWWEAGEGSCCGALDTWGSLLRFHPIGPPGPIDFPPILTAPSGLSITEGSALSFKVNASDSSTPLQNLVLSCLNCPRGASFSPTSAPGHVTGMFSWTPLSSQVGQYTVTFTVSDDDESSSASILITVYPAGSHNIPPVLIIPGNETVSVGSTLSFDVNATDNNTPPQALVLTCLNCSSLGASFVASTGTSPITGIFSWGPSGNRAPGEYRLYFGVSDSVNTTSAVIPITVTKANILITALVYPRIVTMGSSQMSVSDTATLFGGFNPTGTITFSVFFSNASCTGTPVFKSIISVNTNGYYSSQPFKPQTPGAYQWDTSYAGDLNNFPSMSRCGNSSESMTVTAPPTPPSQPPPGQSGSPSGGSLPMLLFLLLSLGGVAGLVAIGVAISRRRISPK